MLSLGFLFPPVITVVTREVEDSAPANFWGVNKANYGECEDGEYELDKVILFSVRHLRISHHTRTCLPQKFAQPLFFVSNGEEKFKKHVYAIFCGPARCIKRQAQCFSSELNAMKLIPILQMYVSNLLLFLFFLLN